MCTICGHFVNNGKIKSTDIYDMLTKMAHRGPDTHGAYLDGKLIRVDEIEKSHKALSVSFNMSMLNAFVHLQE